MLTLWDFCTWFLSICFLQNETQTSQLHFGQITCYSCIARMKSFEFFFWYSMVWIDAKFKLLKRGVSTLSPWAKSSGGAAALGREGGAWERTSLHFFRKRYKRKSAYFIHSMLESHYRMCNTCSVTHMPSVWTRPVTVLSLKKRVSS